MIICIICMFKQNETNIQKSFVSSWKSFFSADYKKDEDPTLFCSEKTGRGPLSGSWRVGSLSLSLTFLKYCAFIFKYRFPFSNILNQSIYSYSQKTVDPVMTAYKLVTIQFKWWEQLFQCQSVANNCCIWNDEMQDCFNTKRWWCWCWWCLKSILDQMGLQMSQMVIFRWGLQDRVENFIHTTERRLFTNFHRQVETWNQPNKPKRK